MLRNATVSGSGSLPLAPKVNATFGLTLNVTRAGKASGIVGYQEAVFILSHLQLVRPAWNIERQDYA